MKMYSRCLKQCSVKEVRSGGLVPGLKSFPGTGVVFKLSRLPGQAVKGQIWTDEENESGGRLTSYM